MDDGTSVYSDLAKSKNKNITFKIVGWLSLLFQSVGCRMRWDGSPDNASVSISRMLKSQSSADWGDQEGCMSNSKALTAPQAKSDVQVAT